MFYVQSSRSARPIALGAARFATMAALASYPLGALILRFAGDGALVRMVGYGLIAATLFLAAFLATTTLNRIVAEEAAKLDEYELALRSAAIRSAYVTLSGLAVLALFYAGFAAEHGWWIPSTYEDFSGLFWGAVAYSVLLPGAYLAWQADAVDLAPGEET